MIAQRKAENFMIEHTFTFSSFQDQLTIHCLIEIPENPCGILQIVHGMSEHKERYLPFMEAMAKSGWICVIHDHRGHGESVKTKEDLGYFYDTTGTYLMEDVHQLTYLMKQRFPTLPYVLFGHSMGSLLARAYTKKYDYELDGLIICGSPSKNRMAWMGNIVAKLMEKWKHAQYRSPMIQHLAFSKNEKRFHEESPNAWICSDHNVVKAYDDDTACGFVFTLNGFQNLFTLISNVYDEDNWKLLNKQLPIFFIAGSDDPCIVNINKFHEAVRFMEKLGYEHVSSKLYPQMRHEILNERGKEEVYEDIQAFLKSVKTLHTSDLHT